MSDQLTISGILKQKNAKYPLSGFTVTLKTPTQEETTITGPLGEFKFKTLTVPLDADQTTYDVSLSVDTKNDFYQDPTTHLIKVVQGTPPKSQEMTMEYRGPISNKVGAWFLGFLILCLIALGAIYYNKHKPKIANDKKEINSDIVNTLTKSLVARITDDSIKVSAFTTKGDSISSLDSSFISEEFLQIKEASNDLLDASQVDGSIKSWIERDNEDIEQAIKNRNKAEIQAALVTTKSHVKKIPSLLPKWFWTEMPGRYYEILLWALFATLLRLIGNTSYYVSRGIFFKFSIANKLPLLVTIPLIALLITFVISFFKISITLGGTALHLDFSNPFVSIILASLIGLAPWGSWKFMSDLADKFIVALNNWLGLNKSEEDKEKKSDKNEESPT